MITESRSYNTITMGRTEVIKTSKTDEYIQGEIYYYQNIPHDFRKYFPKLIGAEERTIRMERLHGNWYTDLLVHGLLTTRHLERLVEVLTEFHAYEHSPVAWFNYPNWAEKMQQRYQDHDYAWVNLDCHHLYARIMKGVREYQEDATPSLAMIHGDPVFTNVVQPYHDTVKFIDPKGMVGDTMTIYGDPSYDWAKVYQSLCGYDHILHRKRPSASLKKMRKAFEDMIGYERMWMIPKLTASLLFSLIPLHTSHKRDFYDLAEEVCEF